MRYNYIYNELLAYIINENEEFCMSLTKEQENLLREIKGGIVNNNLPENLIEKLRDCAPLMLSNKEFRSAFVRDVLPKLSDESIYLIAVAICNKRDTPPLRGSHLFDDLYLELAKRKDYDPRASVKKTPDEMNGLNFHIQNYFIKDGLSDKRALEQTTTVVWMKVMAARQTESLIEIARERGQGKGAGDITNITNPNRVIPDEARMNIAKGVQHFQKYQESIEGTVKLGYDFSRSEVKLPAKSNDFYHSILFANQPLQYALQ